MSSYCPPLAHRLSALFINRRMPPHLTPPTWSVLLSKRCLACSSRCSTAALVVRLLKTRLMNSHSVVPPGAVMPDSHSIASAGTIRRGRRRAQAASTATAARCLPLRAVCRLQEPCPRLRYLLKIRMLHPPSTGECMWQLLAIWPSFALLARVETCLTDDLSPALSLWSPCLFPTAH